VHRPPLFQPGPILRSVLLGCARVASHLSADARGLGVNEAMPAIIAPEK